VQSQGTDAQGPLTLAESDLIDIWVYSFGEWDDVQTDKYLDELNAAIDSLAGNPYLGVRRDNVREGYRASSVNQHAVYYRLSGNSVDVVRVLHGQMDPNRHLEPSADPK
jgi:toxin ParE1/3/4